jgi:DNA repair protein RadC
LATFKSFEATVSAPVAELKKVESLNTSAIAALKSVHESSIRLARPDRYRKFRFTDIQKVVEYLVIVLRGDTVERMHVLYLSGQFKLLKAEDAGSGTSDHLMIYPREIIRRALEYGACHVVLGHSHPSAYPDPSDADHKLTSLVHSGLRMFGIALQDHIIVGEGGHWYSMKKEGTLYSEQQPSQSSK